MKVIDIRTARPMEYADLSKPLPLPRITCIFREKYRGRYEAINGAAKMWRNLLGRGIYVSEYDLNQARNFVIVEVEDGNR